MDSYQRSPGTSPAASREVRIASGAKSIHGDLTIPADARGLVIFAHGSGSSRFSQRNRWVAAELQRGGLATLLVDLLTLDEAARDQITGEYRFDIQLLARRVVDAIDWVTSEPEIAALPIGLFGASTGAAAALFAAARKPHLVHAVVSRGGRPDLAESVLPLVTAPTLLIVGGRDVDVLMLNRRAASQLKCENDIAVVPGATHLFEEPGALEQVAQLARDWFARHLPRPAVSSAARVGR